MIYETIARCRICGSDELADALDLGVQPLSGVFPWPGEVVAEAPLRLVRCRACGLTQLGESADPTLLYGETYGYRSGLNRSMADHLAGIADFCIRMVDLEPGDLVLDIGSNDGTLVRAYEVDGLERWGVDPLGARFLPYYPDGVKVVPQFFSADTVAGHLNGRKARVVTSIACLYDLERPLDFVADIVEILTDDGIWVTEQSYLPAMIRARAYDTICHEHLEYYRLADIAFLAEANGLTILDAEENGTNGGSFRVTLCRKDAAYAGNPGKVADFLTSERAFFERSDWMDWMRAWLPVHKRNIRSVLQRFKEEGKTVYGYGASTKGNVLLNYCGIGPDLLPVIGEVNEEKFGRVTPGSGIPIRPESELRPETDAFFVLPWHFRDMIVRKEEGFLKRGGKLIFPLPELEVVG